MVYGEAASGWIVCGGNGFVCETDKSMGALAHGCQGEDLRQDGAVLTNGGVAIWEYRAGFQTQEIYDAWEHLHGIELAHVSGLSKVLECEPHNVLAALAGFFAAGGLLSDLAEVLDCFGVAYVYGTGTSAGDVAFRYVGSNRKAPSAPMGRCHHQCLYENPSPRRAK